jgi:hypothetical protein
MPSDMQRHSRIVLPVQQDALHPCRAISSLLLASDDFSAPIMHSHPIRKIVATDQTKSFALFSVCCANWSQSREDCPIGLKRPSCTATPSQRPKWRGSRPRRATAKGPTKLSLLFYCRQPRRYPTDRCESVQYSNRSPLNL